MCENEIAAVGSLFSLMVCSFICLLVCVLACKFYIECLLTMSWALFLSRLAARKKENCARCCFIITARGWAESGSSRIEWRSVAAGGVYLVLLLWCWGAALNWNINLSAPERMYTRTCIYALGNWINSRINEGAARHFGAGQKSQLLFALCSSSYLK